MRGGYEGPRLARPGETQEVLKLVNRIFADGCPIGLHREYPHLYRNMEKNLEYCHVITCKGRIAAHAGVYPLEFVVGDRRVLAGGIGAVCTDERHRGKGLMSALLVHCTDWMRRNGMPLSVLWGDATRYGRFGWRVAGTQVRLGLQARAIPALAKYRDRVARSSGNRPAMDELYSLHGKLRYRVGRSRESFGLIMKKPGRRIYVARCGGRATAYCFVRSVGGHWGRRPRPAFSIDEWAGSGGGILSILRSLLRSFSGSRVEISLPAARLGWWADLLKGADSWSLSVHPLALIKVIDPGAVLKALGIARFAPLIEPSRLGRRGDLGALLFGPLSPEINLPEKRARRLRSVLPLPLFLFPSDHV